MRFLLLGFAAALILRVRKRTGVVGLRSQIDDSSNADDSPKFTDPAEKLEALADGAAGESVYAFKSRPRCVVR
jgi:hypothetical protein